MTHFTNQAELAHMSEKELHLQLRETFNAMVRHEQSAAEYAQAAARLEEIKRALCRRAHSPKF